MQRDVVSISHFTVCNFRSVVVRGRRDDILWAKKRDVLSIYVRLLARDFGMFRIQSVCSPFPFVCFVSVEMVRGVF